VLIAARRLGLRLETPIVEPGLAAAEVPLADRKAPEEGQE
jgi:hypothetical protein